MPQLTEQKVAAIYDALAKNKPVRYHGPEHGNIHIDRQLPFLVVYRRPANHVDVGTDRLLLGEASYLLVEDVSVDQAALSEIVTTIAQIQTEAFGAFLLLEIWAGSIPETEHSAPGFGIYAPKKNCPDQLLEKFESALLKIHINKLRANVDIKFADSVHPPERNTLLNEEQLTAHNWITLGLEVTPIYRDRDATLFPFELKELQRQLARALKQTFYEFIHLKTTHRPAHFHELGRRAMTHAVYETDQQLAAISSTFDLLLHVTPVNASVAWEQFRDSQFEREPEFLYRARPIDPGLLKRQLFKIPLERIEDPTLAHIYSEKREELDRMITLVADRNTKKFLLGSRQLYDDVEDNLLQLAKELLNQPLREETLQKRSKTIGANEFYELALNEVEYYWEQDNSFRAKVEIRDDISGVLVSQGNCLIGSDASVSTDRVDALIAHEIGTHMLTYHNGKHQPLAELYTGMAGYEPMQEGLAVLGEYLSGGIDASRLRLLAGRVMAVKHITEGADFIETFNELHLEFGFDAHNAFYITMRVFRGGGYTKDVVYLRGLSKVLGYLASGNELAPLYLGKVSHEHLSFIRELQWRKVLRPPSLHPRFLDTPLARERLKKLSTGLSMLDLVEA